MGEWKKTTLGAIADQGGRGLVDGPFGSNLPSALYVEAGVPVIRGSNLTLGTRRFDPESFVFVSGDTASRLSRSLCRPLDIIFTKKGTLGQTGIIPRAGPFKAYLLSSNQMKLTVDRQLADPEFVFYSVSSPNSIARIIRDSEATGVPKTNLVYLRQFEILLPPLDEQAAIAGILRSLDDKIELNRRMNETLQATARALFKSWFVDFDPVRAKMARRKAGLSRQISELFPDFLVESGIGAMPSDWKLCALGDLLVLEYGKALKAQDRADGAVVVYGSNGRIGRHTDSLSRGPGIVVGRKGNPGTVMWAASDFFVIDTAYYVRPKDAIHSLHFLFFALQMQNLGFLGADSAVPGLNRNIAYMSTQVLPSRVVQEAFDRIVEPIFLQIDKHDQESRTLAALRDALLPRLISGELRIKDAERFVAGG